MIWSRVGRQAACATIVSAYLSLQPGVIVLETSEDNWRTGEWVAGQEYLKLVTEIAYTHQQTCTAEV